MKHVVILMFAAATIVACGTNENESVEVQATDSTAVAVDTLAVVADSVQAAAADTDIVAE
jgi:hypothetical protein